MKLQVSLLHLMFLLVAVAVWVAGYMQWQEVMRIETQLPGLRDAARELEVLDPDLLNAVESNPDWMEEQKWKIHVPEETGHTLCLATSGLDGDVSLPRSEWVPQRNHGLSTGLHSIEVRLSRAGSNHLVEVRVDGRVELATENPPGWRPGSHTSTAVSDVADSSAFSKKIVVLLNKSFQKIDDHTRACGGIRLWVQNESK